MPVRVEDLLGTLMTWNRRGDALEDHGLIMAKSDDSEENCTSGCPARKKSVRQHKIFKVDLNF